MHKLKKPNDKKLPPPPAPAYKKSFVRNTSQAKPKTVVVLQQHAAPSTKPPAPNPTTICDEPPPTRSILGAPNVNSALKLINRIENVETLKLEDIPRKQAVEEKVTKQVNFPYSRSIYKDLMPLGVKPQGAPPGASREFIARTKDREPSLSDFYEPKKLPEYRYKVAAQPTGKVLVRHSDGLKLYRVMQSWNCS